MPNPDRTPVDVRMIMSIIAKGSPLTAGLFTVGILDDADELLHSAANEASGLVTFEAVRFTEGGTFNYTAKITSLSNEWLIDHTEWPIQIDVVESNDILYATVTYPNGVPTFVNTHRAATCKGPFVFPELTFNTAGTFEYTMEEITPSGDGWITDDTVITVIVTVEDDGHGHLVATVSYPDGFPTFTNTYHSHPARVIISGCKLAIGAPLPAGKFLFGLYDQDGRLVSSVTNESLDDDDDDTQGDE